MKINLKELAVISGGDLKGDPNKIISGPAGLGEAGNDQISFVTGRKYANAALKSKAGALVVAKGLQDFGRPVIVSDNPKLAFCRIIEAFESGRKKTEPGIHPSALISSKARIGKRVAVQAYSVVGDNSVIGDDSIIYPFVYIGDGVEIGPQALIYPNVTISERVFIGKRVIIHSGAVIGCDGFGYVRDSSINRKIPQIGCVIIGDNVEIGSNTAIARAALGATRIGSGVKIDNLVQIAHNVTIGDNSIIVSQVGLSGSVNIGKNVILAGQVGIADHVTIGDNVIVEAQSGVNKDLAPDKIYFGYPAREQREAARNIAEIRNLTNLRKKVKEIELRLNELKNNEIK